ncbi:MAG: DUF362 domain-containing protein, partial [Planctomycetota bacterium]|jgi:hypothetical protein
MSSDGAIAAVESTWYEPSDPCNTPIGTARGIYPGRVVWAYEPDATSWDGTTGNWWSDTYTDQAVVTDMLSDAICKLAGASNNTDAWDKLFKYFNQTHDKGDIGYQPGEKIAIKLNLNMVSSHGYSGNGTFTTPQVVLALLRQMVNDAGVDASCITFFDISRCIPDAIFNRCKAEFPGVHFVGWEAGDGREQYIRDLSVQVHWSDDLKAPTELGGPFPTYLPTCITQADYLINIPNLKGHKLAGVTLCSKNHFGSFAADSESGSWGHPAPTKQVPKGAGLHPYVVVHYFANPPIEWVFPGRPMGAYNPLVDLMGHEHLDGKTMLFLIDGIYGAEYQNAGLSPVSLWQSAPFNNDWTNSIFVSQDPVAIDSVGLDFIRNEPSIQNSSLKLLNAGDSVDNYLHEAALADNPPSGAPYDPETPYTRRDTGSDLPSLGAHEHWNNAIDKQYTRNLGTGTGIELRVVSSLLSSSVVIDSAPPPPAAPTGLAAIPCYGQRIRLDWNDNNEPTLSYYNVLRSTTQGGPYSEIATGVMVSNYTDTGLSNGTTYYYVVTAVVDIYDYESAYSNQASATPRTPTVPTGLTATASYEQVSLDWNHNFGYLLSYYNVSRSTTQGGPYSEIATNLTVSDYTDTGLSNQTTYYYVVTAVFDIHYESADSDEASVKPQGPTVCLTCPGDFDGDYTVTMDELYFLMDLLTAAGSPYEIAQGDYHWHGCGDINEDGLIKMDDMTLLNNLLNQAAPSYRIYCPQPPSSGGIIIHR